MKLAKIFHQIEVVVDKTTNNIISDIQKFENWIKDKTPQTINAFVVAAKITNEFVQAAQSPTGIVVEKIIESVVPQAAIWTPELVDMATKMGKCMQKVADDIPSIQGIALNYLGRMVGVIDKTRQDIDKNIEDAQKLFTK